MKPYIITRHKTKRGRRFIYAVHGFWSGDNVNVSQSVDLKDGKWEAPQINWSCGGRSYTDEPDDSIAVACFANAMADAARVAQRWKKDRKEKP